MRCTFIIAAALLLFAGTTVSSPAATALECLENAVLVPSPGNDGDSFNVRHGARELTIRLYYVDCPETVADSSTDARRVRAQTRYFGLPGHDRTLHFGRQATTFSRERLSRPFTVHTAYATAQGRGASIRYYAFVTTAAGEDLGLLLVEQGLARSHGVRRELPDGTPGSDAGPQYDDREVAAMLERRGIWSETDAKRLVVLRADARREEAELKEITIESRTRDPIPINSASIEELQTVSGIGPARAAHIIKLRPFANPADLDRIAGIAAATRAELRARATFE